MFVRLFVVGDGAGGGGGGGGGVGVGAGVVVDVVGCVLFLLAVVGIARCIRIGGNIFLPALRKSRKFENQFGILLCFVMFR